MSGRKGGKANNHILLPAVMEQCRKGNGKNPVGGQVASQGTSGGENLRTVIETMLKTKNPFTPTKETGRTILHLAAQLGNSNIVRDLLRLSEAVKYIAAKDDRGETPIDLAERFKHTEVHDLLVAALGRDPT